MCYLDPLFWFSVYSSELLLKQGDPILIFLLFQNFLMSFLINLSNRLASLINLLRKNNEVSFTLERQ